MATSFANYAQIVKRAFAESYLYYLYFFISVAHSNERGGVFDWVQYVPFIPIPKALVQLKKSRLVLRDFLNNITSHFGCQFLECISL